MSKSYPIIIFPKEIKDIYNHVPDSEIGIKEPIKPILKQLPKPNIPQKPNTFGSIGLGILILGISIVLFFINQAIGTKETPTIFVLLMVGGPILGIFMIGKSVSNHSEDNSRFDSDFLSYKRDLEEYEKKLSKLNEEHKNQMIHYEEKLKFYLHNVNNQTSETFKEQQERYITLYRKKQLYELLKTIPSPQKIDDEYKRGLTEDAFYRFLRSKSDLFIRNHTLIDKEAKIKNYIKYNSNSFWEEWEYRSYMPDIIYFNPSTGLVIDIEIDEPYSNGHPIHYIGADMKRNLFFIKNNWIIIRFAEIQAHKYPRECYFQIMEVVNAIERGEKRIRKVKVLDEPCWSKERAQELITTKYRNKYLTNTPFI